MHFGFLELAIILVVILLLLGPKQIPKLVSTIKSSIGEFKNGAKDNTQQISASEEKPAEVTKTEG